MKYVAGIFFPDTKTSLSLYPFSTIMLEISIEKLTHYIITGELLSLVGHCS